MGKMDAPEIEETETQKELAKIAQEKWDIAKETLQPLEDMMVADVSKGITAAERETAQGAVGSAHQSQFGEAQTQTIKQLSAAGVDPTSGKAQSTLSDLATSAGVSRAAGESGAEAGLQSKQMQEEMNLINVGAGEAAGAQQGMMDVTGREAQRAMQSAQTEMAENQATQELVGTLGGLAAGYYGSKPKMTDAQLAKKHGIKY